MYLEAWLHSKPPKKINDPALGALPPDADLTWVHRCLQRALKTDRPLRMWVVLDMDDSEAPFHQIANAFVNSMFQQQSSLRQDDFKRAWMAFTDSVSSKKDSPTSKKFTKDAALRWIYAYVKEKQKQKLQRIVLSNLDPSSLLEDYAIQSSSSMVTLHVMQDTSASTMPKPTPLTAWLDQRPSLPVLERSEQVLNDAASLGYVSARFPLSSADIAPHFLSETFATFPLSTNIPFVSLYTTRDTDDASTPVGTHRILRSAQVPMPQVRKWTHPLISSATAARTPLTILRLAILLRAAIPGEAPWYAQVMLRHATGSAQLTGLLRISLVNQAESASIGGAVHSLNWIEDIIAAIKKAIAPVRDRTISACVPWIICLLRTYAQRRTAADAAIMTLTPQASIQGTAVVTLPLPLDIKAASIATTLAARAAPGGPLGPWLMLVAQSAKTLVLMYRNATGASNSHRISRLMRLLWTRPRDDVIRELQLTFGMNEATATMLYDEYASKPNAFHIPILQWMRGYDECPFIIIELQGRTEMRASIHNISRHAYLPRILTLLRLLVSPTQGATNSQFPKLPLLPSKSKVPTSNKGPGNRNSEISKELADLVSRELSSEDGDHQVGDANVVLEEEDVEEGEEGAGEQSLETEDDLEVPSMYVLKRLHKADLPLFKFPGTRYATICGKNNMRQPIALHLEDLERINREYPGAHSGALTNHGSSPALASKNAYICPKVWCPMSRTALNMEQFNKLGKRCPGGSEDRPIVYDQGYFKGRERYVGLIDAQHHPRSLQMPCCFLKPTRLPSSSSSPPSSAAEPPLSNIPTDIKYVRGDTAPLEPGRYGILPPELARVLHSNVRKTCGPRDDGSGQLTSRAKCFVHRGVPQHPQGQALLACLAEVLDVKEAPTADALVALIASRLSATEFLQLDGGRLARRFMSNIDPMNDVFRYPDATADLFHWLSGGGNGYVKRFGLSHLAAEAKQFASSSKAKDKEKAPSLELQREALVRAGMRRYLERLEDASIIKTARDGLIELASWPLTWLNPHRANILLLERASSPSSTHLPGGAEQDLAVFVACPDNPPANAWRHDDPIIILLRQGAHYEPVAQVKMVHHRIQETLRFIPDMHPRIARAVRTFIGTCASSPSPRMLLPTKVLSAMELEGDAAMAQVIDYAFRLVGFLSSHRKVFVPISTRDGALPLLLGNVGYALDVRYQSDLSDMCSGTSPQDAKQLLVAVASRVGDYSIHPQAWIVMGGGGHQVNIKDVTIVGSSAPPKNTVAIRSSGGAIVPLRGFSRVAERSESVQWLSDIAALVTSSPMEHPAILSEITEIKQRNASRRELLKRLKESDELSSDLRILRSSLYPLTVNQRRKIASLHFEHLIRQQRPPLPITSTIDWLLFSPLSTSSALTQPVASAATLMGTTMFTDVDVATGTLSDLLADQEGTSRGKDVTDVLESELPMDRPRIRSLITLNPKSRSRSRSKTNNTVASVSVSVTATYSTGSSILKAVDAYAAIHLAHRILHSDAAFSLSAGVSAVQNAYARERKGNGKGKGAAAIEPGSSLGRLEARGADVQAIMNAIASRGSSYSVSTFEMTELARFFKVDVRIRSGTGSPVSLVGGVPESSKFLLLQRSDPPPSPVGLVWARTPPYNEFTLLHEIYAR